MLLLLYESAIGGGAETLCLPAIPVLEMGAVKAALILSSIPLSKLKS
jgi:hypothetical protein